MNQPFVSAKLNSQRRADVLRDRGGCGVLHEAAHGRAASRPDLADRIRQRSLRRHAVHDRLRQRAAQHAPHRAPEEWERFPDQGTIIIQAIQQATQLFEAFDFLDASGNLIVIFSDGQDTQTLLNGQSIDSIMSEARRHKIPVYFIRMAYNKSLGGVVTDDDLAAGHRAHGRAVLLRRG